MNIQKPVSVNEIRDALVACDGILVVGPEDNKQALALDIIGDHAYATYCCNEGMRSYSFIKMLTEAFNNGRTMILNDLEFMPSLHMTELVQFMRDHDSFKVIATLKDLGRILNKAFLNRFSCVVQL